MTDEQIRDEAMTLFLAGHETTAIALTWTWDSSRATRPRARLHAELDEVLGDRDPSRRVPRLRYTREVVDEVDAADPPAWSSGGGPRVGAAGRLDVPAGRRRVASGHPPRPALLGRAGDVPARTLVERRDRRGCRVRLLPVRRRHPRLHRQELRLDWRRSWCWRPWRGGSASGPSTWLVPLSAAGHAAPRPAGPGRASKPRREAPLSV